MRLIDSDIIIWNWRSQESAATLLAAEPFAISAVTYMELVQGMRNARELKNLRADLALRVTRPIGLSDGCRSQPCTARQVRLFAGDADLFQGHGRQPAVFTGGIDQNARDCHAPRTIDGILDPASYGKRA
jgi:hypothetical protein